MGAFLQTGKKRRGFTLTEVLVTLAIILLIGVTLTSLGAAERERRLREEERRSAQTLVSAIGLSAQMAKSKFITVGLLWETNTGELTLELCSGSNGTISSCSFLLQEAGRIPTRCSIEAPTFLTSLGSKRVLVAYAPPGVLWSNSQGPFTLRCRGRVSGRISFDRWGNASVAP